VSTACDLLNRLTLHREDAKVRDGEDTIASTRGRVRSPEKFRRRFGNIRVTEGIGRITCGWLDDCVLSRLTNN